MVFRFFGAVVFFLAALGILLLQALAYLQYGVWPSFSIIDAAKLFSTEPWLYEPASWLGLHKILASTPTTIALVGIGFAILAADG